MVAVAIVGAMLMELYRMAVPMATAAVVASQALGLTAAVVTTLRSRSRRVAGFVVVFCSALSPAAVPALWLMLYSSGTNRHYRSVAALSAVGTVSLVVCTGIFLHSDGYGPATDMLGVLGLFSWAVLLGAAATGSAAGVALSLHEDTVRDVIRRDIESASQARLAEREQLSREIHDVIGHRLALLNVFSAALLAKTTLGDDETRGMIEIVESNVQGAAADLGQLLEVLHRSDGPAEVGPTPEPLDTLFDRFLAAGMDLTVTRADQRHVFTESHRRTLERFCREGLTNALKYAAPGPVLVDIRASSDSSLQATIRSPFLDSTRTEPAHHPQSSSGIAGLEQRAALLGGSVWVTVAPSHLDLHLRLPATDTSAKAPRRLGAAGGAA